VGALAAAAVVVVGRTDVVGTVVLVVWARGVARPQPNEAAATSNDPIPKVTRLFTFESSLFNSDGVRHRRFRLRGPGLGKDSWRSHTTAAAWAVVRLAVAE